MDLCLIAASDFSWLSPQSWLNIFQMAAGLGVVIFVHELGHFLVAKACGVKCEKFYLGFDVPMPKIGPFQIPSKLVHFQYGETEYGIGIIPLGGYVKMLGQDDNPANAEKEAERTRIAKDTPGDDAAVPHAHHESITDVNMEPQPLADQVPFEVDPRSYTAKNVPQRMAIISAGVIMNVIFAVIFATIAYKIGVPYTPTFIGGTQPGSPAWVADLPIGGQIVQIGKKGNEREHLRFKQDFAQTVLLHGYESDLALKIAPRGGGEAQWVNIRPEGKDVGMLFGKMALIGVQPMAAPKIAIDRQVIEGFPAALAKTPLLAGDRIVGATAGGETVTIELYPDLNAFLARHADDEVQLQIERTLNPGTPEEKTEKHTIDLARRPLQTLGLRLEMGPITAIQQNSPAASTGLKVGDVLEAINGQKIIDPMLVADDVRRLAGQEITVTVLRDRKPVEIQVTPRPSRDAQTKFMPDDPVLVDALGITLRVNPQVASVAAESPLHGKIEPGDTITNFQLTPAGKTPEEQRAAAEKLAKASFSTEEVSFVEGEYSEGKHDWPAAFNIIQWIPPGTQVKLTFERKGKSQSVVVTPYEEPGYFFAGRGLAISPLELPHQAKTWSEAFYLGRRETWESLGLVVTFLKKLVTGQIALTSLGGPGTIAVAATSEASRGPAALLIFLTMLSANLAVVNFLPIPVLDGGHMMFLAYEGIFRRPVNEKWQIRLSLLGLSFVLCLMVFVIGLDFYRLSGLAQ